METASVGECTAMRSWFNALVVAPMNVAHRKFARGGHHVEPLCVAQPPGLAWAVGYLVDKGNRNAVTFVGIAECLDGLLVRAAASLVSDAAEE